MKSKFQLVKDQKKEIAQLAKSGYDESGLEDLLVVTGIAVEFYDWLKDVNVDLLNQNEAEYNSDTVFAAINFFCHVCSDYSVLIGAVDSNIDWGVISVQSLRTLIILTYERFDEENNFLKKCRLLLDLYKMELVFAGLVYGNADSPPSSDESRSL